VGGNWRSLRPGKTSVLQAELSVRPSNPRSCTVRVSVDRTRGWD